MLSWPLVDNCLWDSGGIQRCLWGGSLWFIYMRTMILKWKCVLASVSHGKKDEMLYEDERYCILLFSSGKKGLRITYGEVMIWIINWDNVINNNAIWMIKLSTLIAMKWNLLKNQRMKIVVITMIYAQKGNGILLIKQLNGITI